jgi:DNA-binding MarR family transcriptional regulator
MTWTTRWPKLGLNRSDVIFPDVLDRLERAGYVRRVADPSDRRRVLIEAIERAPRVGSEVYGPIAKAVMASEHRFTHEQLEGILELLKLGREVNLRRVEELRKQMSG